MLSIFGVMKGLVDYLEVALAGEKPGEKAHYKMAPYKRPNKEQVLSSGIDPRLSAVMVLLYPKENVPHLVLMKRPEYNGAHSGQVSFPGGKMEESDADLEHTARREAEEETGISGNAVNVIGQLTEIFIPPSGFLVSPYVGWLPSTPTFTPDQREVAQLIETPVETLLDESIVQQKKIHIKSHNVYLDTPYFDIQGHVVWGATCMLLSELKEILKQR